MTANEEKTSIDALIDYLVRRPLWVFLSCGGSVFLVVQILAGLVTVMSFLPKRRHLQQSLTFITVLHHTSNSIDSAAGAADCTVDTGNKLIVTVSINLLGKVMG